MVLPLSLPGVFAGVLLTFVPVGLGLRQRDDPRRHEHHDDRQRHPDRSTSPTSTTRSAAALSFILMAVLLIGIFAYARALGTEDVLEVAAA